MDNLNEFQSNVMKLVSRILTNWRNSLAAVGLHTKLFDPETVLNEDNLLSESEIEIWFLDANENVKDVLEFHLIIKGEQVTDLQEIDKWLDENINKIVAMHRI